MKTLKNEQEQKVKHLTQIITFITKTHITPQAEKQGLPTYRIVTPRFSQHINCSSLSSEQLFTSLLHTSLCLHSLLSPFWMTKWQCVLWLVWINEFVGQLVHVAATSFRWWQQMQSWGEYYFEFFLNPTADFHEIRKT